MEREKLYLTKAKQSIRETLRTQKQRDKEALEITKMAHHSLVFGRILNPTKDNYYCKKQRK